jgi:hypothetical protein
VFLPRQQLKLARGPHDKEHAMSQTAQTAVAVIGIDIGKNSFHIVGHDGRGAIAASLPAPTQEAASYRCANLVVLESALR